MLAAQFWSALKFIEAPLSVLRANHPAIVLLGTAVAQKLAVTLILAVTLVLLQSLGIVNVVSPVFSVLLFNVPPER